MLLIGLIILGLGTFVWAATRGAPPPPVDTLAGLTAAEKAAAYQAQLDAMRPTPELQPTEAPWTERAIHGAPPAERTPVAVAMCGPEALQAARAYRAPGASAPIDQTVIHNLQRGHKPLGAVRDWKIAERSRDTCSIGLHVVYGNELLMLSWVWRPATGTLQVSGPDWETKYYSGW
jgi:hypothetical protein